jgi:hypothetical protein
LAGGLLACPKGYQYGDRLARRNRSQRFGIRTVPTAVVAKERQDPQGRSLGVFVAGRSTKQPEGPASTWTCSR